MNYNVIRKISAFTLCSICLLPAAGALAQDLSTQVRELHKQSKALKRQSQDLQGQVDRLNKLYTSKNNGGKAKPTKIDLTENENFKDTVADMVKAMRPIEIYGSLRLSLDYGDSDVSKSQVNPGLGLSDGDFGLSANTTVIGFRGSSDFDFAGTTYSLIYQLEQNFNPGLSEGDTLGNRDTFGGLVSPWGKFRAGLLSTPFKEVGIAYTKYTTFVSDPHAILGTGPTAAGRLGLRAANSLRWDKKLGDVTLAFQYGFDQNRGSYGSINDQTITGTQGVLDDNSNDMYSASASWKLGDLNMAAAYVDYSALYAGSEVSAYRLAAKYAVGEAEFGGIYENIDGHDYTPLSRDAYGAYATYNIFSRLIAGIQWMHADETDRGNDDADQGSFNLVYPLTRVFLVYASVTKTYNSKNARYRTADYAHGDRINTVPGGDPASASIGINLKF